MDVIKSITQEYEKSDIPAFGVGDTVKVHIKIKEGNRERVQIFEGFVLKKQKARSEELSSTTCVREQVKLLRSKLKNSFYGGIRGDSPFF